MTTVSESIERLIVRHLDGELSTEEELALQHELLKNPVARELLDEYARWDAVAACALQSAVRSPVTTDFSGKQTWGASVIRSGSDAAKGVRLARNRHHWARSWMLIPGAIAAAILALVVPYPKAWRTTDHPSPVASTSSSQPLIGSLNLRPQLVPGASEGVMRTVSDTPWLAPRVQRDTGRDVIGVQGTDGNIYWLEVSRVRTLRQPERASIDRPVSESL